jgi:hypothetical protein
VCILAPVLALAIMMPAVALAAAPAEPQALEEAWHSCIRDAFAHQPAGQSRAGNERNALDECREREDAYVAASMAARSADAVPQNSRARVWASYVGFVLDPVKAWIEALRR